MAAPSRDFGAFRRLETEERGIAAEGRLSDTGQELLGEFVKSYGFAYDREQGWSWDAGNIGKAFEEHPFWTTLDYVTLAVPVAKWGTAAAKVMRGTSWAGRAFAAGELGFGEAAAKTVAQAPRTRLGRLLSSTAEARYSERDAELMTRFGSVPGVMDEADRFGVASALMREFRVSQAAVERRAQDLISRSASLPDDVKRNLHRALELDPVRDKEAYESAWGMLTPNAREMYSATAEWRNQIHNESFQLGLISPETFMSNLGRWFPRVHEDLVEKGLVDTRLVGAGGPLGKGRAGYGSFGKRVREDGAATQILDPAVGINGMARVAMTIAQQKFANRLVGAIPDSPGRMVLGPTRSPLVRSRDELVASLGSIEDAEKAGWQTIDRVFPGARNPRKPAAVTAAERAKKILMRRSEEHQADWGQLQRLIHQQHGRVEKMKMSAALRRMLDLTGGQDVTKHGGRLTMEGLEQQTGRNAADYYAKQRVRDLGAEADRLAGQTATAWSDRGLGTQAVDIAGDAPDPTGKGGRALLDRVNRRMHKRGVAIQNALERIDGKIAREWENARKPTLLRHMPDGAEKLYLDPAIAEDLQGMFSPENANVFSRLYNGILGAFKQTHTSLNPATHVRNTLGNLTFQSFVSGFGRTGWDFLAAYPRGARELTEQGAYYKRAVRAGILDVGFDREIATHLRKAYGEAIDPDALTWVERALGGGSVGRFAQQNVDRAARWYRTEDEVGRLGAFMQAFDRFRKGGLGEEAATERAALEVARFMPNLAEVSPLVRTIRQGVPFASFGAEAARIWKNAMIYKPHMAFWWQHLADAASGAFGAMAGLSREEVDAARESLPWYTKGKKMLLLPVRTAEGKPQFLDASYIIPMADMGADAELAESSFFGLPIPSAIHPLSNPVWNVAAAVATKKDPFTGRDLEPKFTERTLGLAIPEGGQRGMIGLAEHSLRMLLPPLVPPAYGGVNLIDLARGTKSGITGEELQQGAVRSVLANVAGLRTVEPKVRTQLANIRHEQERDREAIANAWSRWSLATANGRIDAANAQARELMATLGPKKFLQGVKRHTPGAYAGVSREQLRDVIARSSRFEARPEELWPVYLQYFQMNDERR